MAATRVDLAAVSMTRARSWRVGPSGSQLAFSADGATLLYTHPGPADGRNGGRVCGVNALGSPRVEVDVRTRRCQLASGPAGQRPNPGPAPCATLVPDTEVALYGQATRSGRHLAFARMEQTAPPRDIEIFIGDLAQDAARPIARVTDAQRVAFLPVGDAERFIMVVYADAHGGLYDVDAETGAVVRLGRPNANLGPVVISPDGRYLAYNSGPALPERPPMPESNSGRGPTDGLDFGNDPDRMPGCDPVGYPPGGCGWASDGCGGHTYLGDCPGLLRARAQAMRSTALSLLRLPER